jgi:hypothetical protein
MTICCECGKDKSSYTQSTLGRVLAWKCQECTFNYKIVEFKTYEDELRGIQIMKDEQDGFLTNDKLRQRLKDYGVEYWVHG